MLRSKLIGLVVASVAVVTGVLASSAVAQPEFSKSGNSFTATSGTTVLQATGTEIKCTKGEGNGEITSLTTESTTLKFKECSGTIGGKKCPAEITTKALKGELGDVASGEATSEVGLLFTAVEGPIAQFSCEGTTLKVEGSVAGEVGFVAKGSEVSPLTFTASGTEMKIKTIKTSSEQKPVMKINGAAATLSSTETEKSVTKGIDIFICLPRTPGEFASLVLCSKSEGKGVFTNGWNQFDIW